MQKAAARMGDGLRYDFYLFHRLFSARIVLAFQFISKSLTDEVLNKSAFLQCAGGIGFIQFQVGWIPHLHTIRRQLNTSIRDLVKLSVEFTTQFAKLNQIMRLGRFSVKLNKCGFQKFFNRLFAVITDNLYW